MALMPDELIEFAWSAPMRELAVKLEMSDVAARHRLNRFSRLTFAEMI
jgi:hypothetical protein